MSDQAKKLATVADLVALPEELGMELVDGEIVRKALPTARHGDIQSSLAGILYPFKKRKGGPGGDSGWWITTEVDVEYAEHAVFRHDLVGWRRDRVPALPDDFPVNTRPDWVCEIVSKGNRTNDTIRKSRALHLAHVPHYWLVDFEYQSLMVHRWHEAAYLLVQQVCPGDKARLEPFERVELDMSELFGVDTAPQ